MLTWQEEQFTQPQGEQVQSRIPASSSSRDFVNFLIEQRVTVSYGSYGELRLENTILYMQSYGGGIYSLICYHSRATESYGELQRAMGTYG